MTVPSTYIGNASPQLNEIQAQDGNLEITDGGVTVQGGALGFSGTLPQYGKVKLANGAAIRSIDSAGNTDIEIARVDGNGDIIIGKKGSPNATIPNGEINALNTPYAAKDWHLLTTQSVGDDSNASTANTNWTDVNAGSLSAVRPTEADLQTYMPTNADGNIYVTVSCAYNENGDAIDFRLRDEANATTIASWSGLTGGWTGFNPAPNLYSWANDADVELQFRNNDGATTVYATKSVTFKFYTKV